MKERTCKLCGDKFIPKYSRQLYCKKDITTVCPVCGDGYTVQCSPDQPTTCSKSECKKKAGYIGSISKLKKCKICGKEFKPTSPTQEYCNEPVERVCKVCGNTFTIRCTAEEYKKQTCSVECMNRIALEHREATYTEQTKICELCGQPFHPRTNTQRVCESDHFRNCVICGKEFKLEYRSAIGQADLRVTCSDECEHILRSKHCAFSRPEIREKIKLTMLNRYGVESPSQNAEILSKQKATMMERYGVEFFTRSELYKERAETTNLERYGTAWASQSEEIQSKIRANNLEKYGYEYPMQSPEIKQHFIDSYRNKTGYNYPMQNPEVQEKTKQSNLEKYGVEFYAQTDEYKEKYKATSLERYGTEHPVQNQEIRSKIEATNLERYGTKNAASSPEVQKKISETMMKLYGTTRFSQLPEWKLNKMIQCDNIDEWMKFVEDPESYILSHYESRPTYRTLAKNLGTKTSTVSDVLARKKLTHLIKYCQSYMEEDMRDFLDELGVEYKMHNRFIISPYEIDIYISEFKFGIECDPTGTHNSSIPYKGFEENYMPPSYHKMKTDLCEEQGIQLLHIFGYDWTHKKDVILSMIRNKLRRCKRVIYARKCKVVEVSGVNSIKFLDENHRQGAANSPIRLGLEYNGELVSLMTFGKMRGTIGTSNEDLENCYELVRFCSLLNTSVVGAASRLLKHFIEDYRPERIRSFSDRAHTSGDLYKTLGFKEIRRSSAGYVWVNVFDDRAYHRVNAQKQNIKKFLQDDSIDLNKTEREIMVEHGFVQVFDSGTITWEWRNN